MSTQQKTQPTQGRHGSGAPPQVVSASLRGVGKTFRTEGRTVEAVRDLDLEISEGEYVVILGPSGCGKSTLIRCVAGLESPTRGSIHLQGRPVFDAAEGIDLKPNQRQVGMVFQSYALWPHMTVARNVGYPLKMRKIPRREREDRVAKVLDVLECGPLSARLPAELSGGQQQRIALARALVYEPGILLLDEPLSNLDALLRVSLRTELLRLHRALGYTALHITHDQEEALGMGDRVVLMREGRIEQIGVPEEVYARPVSPYAANFLGVRNRLSVRLSGGLLHYEEGVLRGSEELARGAGSGTLELFARSRDTVLCAGELSPKLAEDHLVIEGTLDQVVLGEGGRRQYLVDVGGKEWFAQKEGTTEPSPGDRVQLAVPTDRALLYRDDELVIAHG